MTEKERQLERVQYIKNKIEKINPNSKRKAAERDYALDLIRNLECWVKQRQLDDFLNNSNVLRKLLLDGAENWTEYSEGGCSLIYNEDIIERIGRGHSPLLERQAKYLYRACEMIINFNKEAA